MPNGEMLSMPIPISPGEKGVSLNQINWGEHFYAEVIQGLYPNLKGDELFHFDPEINRAAKESRHEKWMPAFGQAGAAQTHLENENIEIGDIFLFFGSFIHTYENSQGKLTWEKEHEFHAVFGYLEIGEIISAEKIQADYKADIYERHPHFENRNIYNAHNTLYIASENLSDTALPGAGTFKFRNELRLTKKGYKKSQWTLPAYFHPEFGTTISRCLSPIRYRKDGDNLLFEPVSIGQDMVVRDSNEKVESWAKNLIKTSTIINY